jgi:prepilin-type N-terminal cleavage/methylation domain-containing protein
MSKGFTLIEMVLTLIVLSILSAFTFSVVWQYAKVYADTKGGYIHGEAAAVMERVTRELRDAAAVDAIGTNYINFQLTHGTPGLGYVNGAIPTCSWCPPPWIQYCTYSSGGRTYLYRVQNTSQGAANQCQSGAPTGANASLMSRNVATSGFQVTCYPGNGTCGNLGPISDGYGITLKLVSDQTSNSQSVTLVSRITPRNYFPYNAGGGTVTPSGLGSDRDFSSNYYDAIQ